MKQIPDNVIDQLLQAERVVVLTGPGVSTEVGVPTVRESFTGAWAHLNPSDLATPQAFLRNPRLVWEWYTYRRNIIDRLEPGAAHYALVDLEQFYPEFLLITQNVDGLHWRAGSRELLELHGNIGRSRCFECGAYETVWDDESQFLPPSCIRCGGLLRPDVIWLGEGVPEPELNLAYRTTERAQVFLSIGISAGVQPAASLPLIARRSGGYLIEINPEETMISGIANCWLEGHPGEVLSSLIQHIVPGHSSEEDM